MPMQTPAALARTRDALAAFTPGQKVVSALAVAGLVLGGVAFVRWASEPAMVPLFTNLAPSDAAAIVEQLDGEGTGYELASGGSSVLVPQEDVYQLRLKMSSQGLPSAEETGYALLDQQGVTTSQFQQQVTYQRAMEGELASTIGSIAGVQGATVHLAVPEKDVFLTENGKPTASVLVQTAPGTELGNRQVDAVVNLVASAVQDLDPADVSVVDGEGRLLSADAGGTAARDEETAEYETRLRGQLQTMLDQVLGKGTAVATVTAQLDLDATDTTSETFVAEDGVPPLSTSRSTETYTGTGGVAAGVLGPDNIQVPGGGAGEGSYEKEETTSDNAVGKVTERRVGTPGDVVRQSVAVVVDTGRAGDVNVADLTQLVTTSAGIDAARGDTVAVTRMPFDTAAADAATQATEAAAAAAAADRQAELIRTLVLGGIVLLLLAIAAFGAWRRRRRAGKQQDVVHDLPWERVEDPAPALASLGAGGDATGVEAIAALPTAPDPAAGARAQVEALVERQPDEVAELLRGWLADRRS